MIVERSVVDDESKNGVFSDDESKNGVSFMMNRRTECSVLMMNRRTECR